VFNFKVINKNKKPTSFNKLKILLSLNGKNPKNQEPIVKEENPLFYCSLCSKHMNYTDLIDGCKCCSCDNDLFVILWNEYKNRMSKYTQKLKNFSKMNLN